MMIKRFNLAKILAQLFVALLLFALAGTQGVSAQMTCPSNDIDQDDNGLIEICDLEGLNAMRDNRSGSGTMEQGCPSTCTGFELTKDLDFNNDASYRTIANKTTWTTGDGFEPIGVFGGGRGFSATFNGNGYTISNLYINRNGDEGDNIGLFGATRGQITNLGLLNVDITGRSSVGGLAGRNSNTITNSYVSGTVSGSGSVGGLVGTNAVAITNSCATASVSGSGDQIGGLVGNSDLNSTITNSCATGTVSGSGSRIGGLVGSNRAAIKSSYATGSVSGDGNNVGGLVGFNNGATIENSYATGSVSGLGNNVGGLVGSTLNASKIENSYATGTVEGSDSSNHIGGLVGNDTSIMISNSYWLDSSASSGGTGVPTNTEKTIMELISPTAAEGIYSSWSADDWDFGTSNQFPIIKDSGSDILTNLPLCTLDIPVDDGDDVKHAMDIDKDNDGLIEICDVEGLDEMRHQLNGSSYKTTPNATIITAGCPSAGCKGYELARSLDFMASDSYRPATNEATYTTRGGWQPIGDFDVSFNATFDGNGHTISNLAINRGGTSRLGLFGSIASGGKIANLGLLDANTTGRASVGGLAGHNNGTITNSYATGNVIGSSNNVGGLVGFNNQGTITNSYAAAVSVIGSGAGTGGLVGSQWSIITNSYATALSVSGRDEVGGLVGVNDAVNKNPGILTNSYAMIRVVAGSTSDIGGLAGGNTGTINDSYWLRGSATSGGTNVATDTSKTTVELTSPTRATGIYSNWGPDDWDFGTSNQFPALKYAKGTDTNYQACSDTPPQTGIDQPQCRTLLPHQGMEIGDRDSGLRESLRELDISGPRIKFDMPFGISTNNYVVTILFREGITTDSVVLRLKAYNPDAEIQIFKAGDSTDYFAGKMSGDESSRIVVADGTKLTIRTSEPDTDYTLTFDFAEDQGIKIRVKIFLEGPLQ